MVTVEESVRLPKTAYRYWPTDREAAVAPGRHGRRLIFHRQELTEVEEDYLHLLQMALDSSPLVCNNLPEDWSRCTALRFLYAAKWDLQLAVRNIETHLEWRKNRLRKVYPDEPPLQVMNSGGLYIHGRDHCFRPLLIIRPSLLCPFPLDQVLSASSYLLEFLLQHMLLPGQVENWVLLIDMSDCSSIPHSTLHHILTFFTLHYPCRLYNAFVLNVSATLWSSLSVCLSPELTPFFHIEYAGGSERLMEQFNESQVERQYGGKAVTVKQFWPPSCPKGRFYLSGHEQTLSDYSSFPEYFPERSLTEDSEGGRSSGEVLYLSDLLGQILPKNDDDAIEIVSANAPRTSPAVRYPAVAVLGPPTGCCHTSCRLL